MKSGACACAALFAAVASPAGALHAFSFNEEFGDDPDQAAQGEGGLPASAKRAPVKETWPWYHSADEIHTRLSELAGNCNGADLQLSQSTEMNTQGAAGQTVSVDVVRISKKGGDDSRAKTKAMLVYGEHAREIISPESALNFIENLCGTGPAAQRASEVLENTTFVLVPNANPISRKVVEDGYYCKRTNEDGVDLNRNFGDTHRVSGEQPGEEMNPGPQGFSEPESRIIKSLVDQERPDIYVSVHSGAYLLGMPFGYSASATPDNENDMLEVLQPISEHYCEGNCPYGNLAKLINYENPGCDIDYVKEQVGSPYVFTWEIYVGEMYRQRYTDEAHMQREQRGTKGDLSRTAEDGAAAGAMSFTQIAEQRRQERRSHSKMEAKAPEAKEMVDSCIDQFNPQSREETETVVAKWTNAYLDLCQAVDAKQQKKAQAASHAPAAGSSMSLVAGTAEASLSDWPDLAGFKA